MNKGDAVRVTVNEDARDRYIPDFLHEMIGVIFQIDDEHIWVNPHHGSICRYMLMDVIVELLPKETTNEA